MTSLTRLDLSNNYLDFNTVKQLQLVKPRALSLVLTGNLVMDEVLNSVSHGIGTLLVVLSCVVYAYACVGLELFSSEVTRRRGYCASGDETAADEARTSDFSANETSAANAAALCLDKVENFEAPWNAFLALFQVVTSNNWHDILYPNAAAMRDGGAGEFGRVFAVFYFVSFYE